MCEWNKYGDTRIDPCVRKFVEWLNNKHKTILSCCGHGRYPMTIIIKEGCEINGIRKITFKEIISGKILRIKKSALDKDPKKFYKKDGDGYYYIPEISKPKRLPTTSRRINRK